MLMKYSGRYSPALLQAHPDKVFLFGDNLDGWGKGGQAIVRDEPNAFGIPTKRHPTNNADAWFCDDDPSDREALRDAIEEALRLSVDRPVIVPVTEDGRVSLGLGLAQLDTRCPGLYAYMTDELNVSEAPELGPMPSYSSPGVTNC